MNSHKVYPGRRIYTLIPALLTMTCAGVMMELESLDEPEEEGTLIIGNVLVENIDQEMDFDNWDFPADVVLMGRGDDGVMHRHTVTTDSRGYYALPNAPPGTYAVKAVILPLFGGQPIKLVSPLASASPDFYRMRHPEEEIDYTATWMPSESNSRILDLDIMWLGLRVADVEGISRDRIGKILVEGPIDSCRHRQFWTEGYIYTRVNPLEYLKTKFPDSGWWK